MFHSPKRGVMPATPIELNRLPQLCFIPLNGALCLQRLPEPEDGVTVMFHSPKRGVMPATNACVGEGNLGRFHSPKRGVMPATHAVPNPEQRRRFIPLNGALCLQLWKSSTKLSAQVSFP